MRRSGYTLLEVLLALAIAVLLLGGLYVAVDMQFKFAQSGRELVESSTLTRSVFGRMSADAASAVALSDPARFRNAQSANSANSGAGGAGAGATNGSGTTGTGTGTGTGNSGAAAANTGGSGTSGNATTGSTTSSTTNTNSNAIALPLGVMGGSDYLHLYISRVPREIYANPDNPPVLSDLRRVSYWLVNGDSDSPAGLARQEVKQVTSDDATQLPPGIDNETQYVFAEEVKSLTFSYFDGSEWQDSWDSTTVGADGVTPIGSPRAIAVVIGVAQPGRQGLKTYRHVIPLATANGTTAQQTNNGTTNGGGTSP